MMRIRGIGLSAIVGFFGLIGLSQAQESPVRFGNGIEFTDPAGRFETRLRFRMQNRLVYTSSDEEVSGEVRRTRLKLEGWLHDPRFFYAFQFAFARRDTDFEDSGFVNILRDAVAGWKFTPNFDVKFGLTKLPGNRQRLVSSGELQFPDRSIVNREFNLDRDFGVQSEYRTDCFKLAAALTTGQGRNPLDTDFGPAYTARVDWLPFGAFTGGDRFEGDLEREPKPKLNWGVGYSFDRGARRLGGTIGDRILESRRLSTAFTDATFKYRGFSFYGELMNRAGAQPEVTLASGRPARILLGRGFNLQMGYLLSERWELAARYSQIDPLPVRQGAVGASYYIMGHRLKFQADLARHVSATPVLSSEDATGWVGRFQMEAGI